MSDWDFNSPKGIRAYAELNGVEALREMVSGTRLRADRRVLAIQVLGYIDKEIADAKAEEARQHEVALARRSVQAAESQAADAARAATAAEAQAEHARRAIIISVLSLVVSAIAILVSVAALVWGK
ncbi:hypothetical protein [Paraburkholderia sp. BL17N1]|uniref:hypothetical protein n=1 Tax=Paraburkholderia sp. BL17N1 TaxID=1938798 RepID=UPI0011C43364|nr:hypothetical protein [Paraburkholderia sp. BL17N1]